jgi:hypothetical protein
MPRLGSIAPVPLLRARIVQRLADGPFEFLGADIVSRLQLLFLATHKDRDRVRLIKRVRKERRGPLADEMFLIHSIATAQSRRPGDFAEVGVYRGGSARVICEAKGDKRLRLFDTFRGLPEDSSAADGGVLRKHSYACSRQNVETYLDRFSNVSYYEGVFPQSIQGDTELERARFAFVHLDVDLYESTRDCLEFFYPRMVPGGVILTHDYSHLGGVRRAFDEFFADKPEGTIELPTTQCMVVKL